MSNYEQKDNSGVLFKNDKRESDSHPHAKGSALIGGRKYLVSAWTNESQTVGRYQKLLFTPVDEQVKKHVSEAKQAIGEDAPFDDDIPF